MVRCEVIEGFTLGKFDELQDIKRKSKDKKGELFVGDTFLCTTEMAEYLTKNNFKERAFVKIIEVIPDIMDNLIENTVKEIIKPKRGRKKKE